ncbi:MAG: hypothetical protein ACRDCA_12560 [Serratia sp. (in: enterobacteria)]|uniref:hypothetical protein n=1 Tax=Serratia sp. (in: enterobacteria) TaxID=616 RepID=UPI003F3C20D1
MAIAACYTMDLYCECLECKKPESDYQYNGGFAQYFGENWADCKSQAKAEGWSIHRDRDTCFAPGHKKFKVK